MVVKLVLAARSRRERAAVRRALGPLREQVITQATYLRYCKAQLRFEEFRLSHLDGRVPLTLTDIDDMYSSYIEYLWQEGDPRSWAGDALSAAKHFLAVFW